ncbi:MAG: tetratricopeptide repeat protein, partial [Planctomycetota bacterium]
TNQARLEAVAEEYGDSNASVWAHVMAGNSFLGNASRLAFRDGDASKAEYASAKSHFEDALAISDAPLEAHAKALFGLASVQEATSGGELDEAKASFQRLIDEYPDSPLVPAAEARLKALNRPTTGPLLAWLAEQNPQPADFAQPVDGSPDDEPALEGLPIEPGPGPPIGDADVSIDDVFSDLAGPMTTDDDPTGEEPATGESTAEEPSAEEPAESPDKPEMKAGAEDAPPTDPAADPPADPEAGTEEPAEKPAEGEKPSEDQPAAPAGSSSENEPPAGGSAESGSAGDSE